jgi:creatinine amidohydrolase/Fe(II)-dependent formamide hydrolase-like protein
VSRLARALKETAMSQEMDRRRFVATSALAGAALPLAAEPAAAAQAPGEVRRPRIVRLDLLTSREVGEWMRNNDTIFVPHGPISGHGPWTTLGVHAHGAEAVATLLARRCNGLVYPPLFTCFAGATRLYPGTVPFSYEFHIQVLKAVVRSLHTQGFGRIFLLCYTNPEDAAGLVAARDLFDVEGEIPVAALVATKGLSSEPVRQLLADYRGSAGEALIDYAALRVLNQSRPIAEPELARAGLRGGQDQNPAIRDAVTTLRARGTRGFRYDSEREHSSHGTVGLTHQGQPDIELGLRVLDALADYLLPAVEALKRHRDYLRSHPARRIEAQNPLEP